MIEVNTMIEEMWVNTNNVGAAGMAPFIRALVSCYARLGF
jgi:hypothetical protein